MKTLITGLALTTLALGVTASRADAAPIAIAADSTRSFEIVWSQMVGATELRAVGEFQVTVTDTYTNFLITLTNETPLLNERIHSLGFNTNPNAQSLTNTIAGSYFDSFRLNTNFPSFQRIDVCVYTANNCTGGAQTQNLPGLGATDTFGFQLNGNFSNGIVLDTFAIQFMGDLGSFQFEGDQPPPPPSGVPEPATLLLVALGLTVSRATRYRRA